MDQPVMEPDALEILTIDHRTVENLFELYESMGTGDAEARDKVVREIVRELSIHASIEEQHLYPLMRERLADGEEQVGHALEEHQAVKERLSRIEKADPVSDERHVDVVSLIVDVRRHVVEEEGDLFAKLRAVSTDGELRDVGRRLEAAKKMAPTRPHPNAPNSGPAQKIAGAVAGVVDRIRDGAREGIEEAKDQR